MDCYGISMLPALMRYYALSWNIYTVSPAKSTQKKSQTRRDSQVQVSVTVGQTVEY